MQEKITEIIFEALEDINNESNLQLQKTIDQVLFGESGSLDSLALVTLIMMIEEKIEDELDVSIVLADERAMSQKNSPFRTVEALRNYISLLLKDAE